MKLIPLENILLRYKSDKSQLILDDNFKFSKGSFVNIAGERANLVIKKLIEEYQLHFEKKILFIDNQSQYPFASLSNVDILEVSSITEALIGIKSLSNHEYGIIIVFYVFGLLDEILEEFEVQKNYQKIYDYLWEFNNLAYSSDTMVIAVNLLFNDYESGIIDKEYGKSFLNYLTEKTIHINHLEGNNYSLEVSKDKYAKGVFTLNL